MDNPEPVINEVFDEGNRPLPEDIRELQNILSIIDNKDPETQQLLQGLLKVRYIQERSNFPVQIEVQKQAYLLMCYRTYGPELGKPYLRMAYWNAVCWRGYQGFNYTGAIEAVKKGTDLSGIIMNPQGQPQQPQEPKKHFWSQNKPQGEVLTD